MLPNDSVSIRKGSQKFNILSMKVPNTIQLSHLDEYTQILKNRSMI